MNRIHNKIKHLKAFVKKCQDVDMPVPTESAEKEELLVCMGHFETTTIFSRCRGQGGLCSVIATLTAMVLVVRQPIQRWRMVIMVNIFYVEQFIIKMIRIW